MNPRLALFALLAVAASAADAPTFPPHVIPNSHLRVMPPDANGRHYQLHIGLPASYAKQPTRRYPVVFVTDGYWDFQKITASHGSLVYDKYVPEFITVGMGYAGESPDYDTLRRWELTPVAMGAGSGHSADYLRTIETVFIPFVEREYRVDSAHRVLAGASLGGLFTLYTMWTKPELFYAYIAASPAVVVGNDWLLGYEEAFAKSGRPLAVRLFMAGGGNESPRFLGGVQRCDQRIKSRSYPGLAYEFRIIEGERHAGMQLEAYERGLRFVFAPIAPESGPSR